MLDLLRLVLGVGALLFLLYVPGALILNSLARRSPAPHIFSGIDEWLFTAVLISLLCTGLTGLLLAEIGWFNPLVLLSLVLLAAPAIAFFLGGVSPRASGILSLLRFPGSYPQRVTDRRISRLQRISLGGLLLLAALLFSRPAEMLRGALDSGAYINAGVAIGRAGAILQRDQLMRELDNEAGEVGQLLQGLNPDRYTLARLRMPAFYVLDKKAALVAPQHYALYPVWIAILYSLFGIWGALYATPLLAVMFALAFYFFARRAFSPGAALLALALLIICPVTIWFARYPVSEVITGLLAFGACFAFNRMWHLSRNEEKSLPENGQALPLLPAGERASVTWSCLWGGIAGVALGQIALARPDFIFYMAPVPLYLIFLRLGRKWRPAYSWFLGGLGAMLSLYAIYFAFFGFAYTLDLYHNVIINVRRLWGPLLIVLYGSLLLIFTLDRLQPQLQPLWARLGRTMTTFRWVWAGTLALLMAGYAIYHYLIGPWLPNLRVGSAGQPIPQTIFTTWESYIGAPVDEGSRYNLLRIGWYLSPVGMLLGVIGLVRWIWGRLDAGTGLFFGSLLALSFLFIQETYTDAHYIYTMRRYLPVILPALILGVAWTCQFLWSRTRVRTLGVALAAGLAFALALFFGYTGRVIVGHTEYAGAVRQLTDLASRFGEKSVVLFSNERDEPYVVATPLQYIFGIESFSVNPSYPGVNNAVLEKIVQRWQKQGYNVWVMMSANGGKLHFPNLSLREEGSWAWAVPEYQQLRQQKPSNTYDVFLPFGIYSVQPPLPPPSLPYRLDVGEMDYPALVAGFHRQERDNDSSDYWRWTGGRAILRVPWPQGPDGTTLGAATVRLRLRAQTLVEGLPLLRREAVTVTLGLDNAPVAVGSTVVSADAPFQDYEFRIPAGSPKKGSDAEYALLIIDAAVWERRPDELGYDERVLGVQLDTVEILP